MEALTNSTGGLTLNNTVNVRQQPTLNRLSKSLLKTNCLNLHRVLIQQDFTLENYEPVGRTAEAVVLRTKPDITPKDKAHLRRAHTASKVSVWHSHSSVLPSHKAPAASAAANPGSLFFRI